MKNKKEKETNEKSVNFYDWFDVLEFEISPQDKKARLVDTSKGKPKNK